MYGYISEHHGYGMTREQSGDYAEDLAATMLASTLGIEFNSDAAWNERKRVYETSNLIIGSPSITAYAEGDAKWSVDLCRGCRSLSLPMSRESNTHSSASPRPVASATRSGAHVNAGLRCPARRRYKVMVCV